MNRVGKYALRAVAAQARMYHYIPVYEDTLDPRRALCGRLQHKAWGLKPKRVSDHHVKTMAIRECPRCRNWLGDTPVREDHLDSILPWWTPRKVKPRRYASASQEAAYGACPMVKV